MALCRAVEFFREDFERIFVALWAFLKQFYINSPLKSQVMLFKGLIGCVYGSLKEMCLTPAVKSIPTFSVSTTICHTFLG